MTGAHVPIRLEARRETTFWVVAYLSLSAFLVFHAWRYLKNFPPVSADEVWIMSASFKLAHEGVFGSDLFAGLYGADRHYFLALPAHHFLQAAFFRVFGDGVVQARVPSLLAAIAVLYAVGWLAYRWVGLECSLATGILLVFWRSNLIATDSRPPLFALAQSGRYDATVLGCWWLAILIFTWHLDKPRRVTAIVSGLLVGITALTQYYGVGALVCCAAMLLWRQRDENSGRLYARDLAIGALLPIVIYAAYVALHWTDFIGQVAIQADRVRFYDPRFYMTNLLGEWRRFSWLREMSGDMVGGWMVVLAFPLTFLAIVRMIRAGENLAFVSVLGAFLSLALLDSTKARIYGSLLVPVLCFGLAATVAPATAARRGIATALRTAAVWLLLIWVVVDGLGGYRFVTTEGPRVSPYSSVAQRIATSLEPQITVLGSQRWWWPLHTFPYRSLNAQWEIWKVEQRANHEPHFNVMLEKFGAAYLILDNDTRGDLTRVPAELRQEVNDLLATRAKMVDAWRDPTYGLIEIYRF